MELERARKLIRSRLAKEDFDLSGNGFEAAVVEMTQIIPGLEGMAPVPGGNDKGRDGTTGDDDEAIMLVCTTQEDVRANLVNSLTRHSDEDGKERKVLVATSRRSWATGTNRQRLRDACTEKGYTLYNVFDETWCVQQFLRHPHFCKRVLGLPHLHWGLTKPPEECGQGMIGFDGLVKGVHESDKDHFIRGGALSGKTALSSLLAREPGWFLVPGSIQTHELLDEIAALGPRGVVFDGARDRAAQVQALMEWRSHHETGFRVVVVGLPSDLEVVTDAGAVMAASSRIPCLNNDQLLEILKRRVEQPADWLQWRTVRQSAGLAGVAGCIASTAARIQGGDDDAWQQLVTGDLFVGLRQQLKGRLGRDPAPDLAMFAMVMNSGDIVSASDKLLGQGRARELRHALVAEGLADATTGQMVILPPVIGSMAIRDAVLKTKDTAALDQCRNQCGLNLVIRNLLSVVRALKLDDADRRFLANYVFASLDDLTPETAYDVLITLEELEDRIFERFPDLMTTKAHELLETHPERVLADLVMAAGADDGDKTGMGRQSPMDTLRRWIQSAPPGTDEPETRRDLLIRNLDAKASELDAARRAMVASLALNVLFHHTTTVPGRGMSVQWTQGPVGIPELQLIHDIWPRIREYFTEDRQTANCLLDALLSWPGDVKDHGQPLQSKAAEVAMHIVNDIADGFPDDGFAHKRTNLERWFDLEASSDLSGDFFAFYPPFSRSEWLVHREQAKPACQELAQRWKDRTPAEAARDFATFQQLATDYGVRFPDHSQLVASELAQIVLKPVDWFQAFIKAGVSEMALRTLVDPSLDTTNWNGLLEMVPKGQYPALRCMIAARGGDEARETLAEELTSCPGEALSISQWSTVSEETIKRLLGHASLEVVARTLEGISLRFDAGLPEVLQETGRAALGRVVSIVEINPYLLRPSGLAVDYAVEAIRGGEEHVEFGFLEPEERVAVVQRIDARITPGIQIARLLETKEALMAYIAKKPPVENLHWVLGDQKLGDIPALLHSCEDGGYEAKEIGSMLTSHSGWIGSAADHYAQLVSNYEQLREQATPWGKRALDEALTHLRGSASREKAREQRQSRLGQPVA